MPLWLSELLADPSLGAEVVAGRGGVDHRGPIRWAHISELPDPTPWLEGGELLLTTGLGVKDSPELQRHFVADVAAHGVVALGFALDVTLDAVPREMLAACDELDLPLFTVPYEIPFLAVSRRVAQHVFDEHYATLRSAVDLHRSVLADVIADAGLPQVLGTVARAMPGVGLIAFDFAGAEIARCDPSCRAGGLAPEELWASLPRDRSRSVIRLPEHVVTSASVTIGDHLEAVVVAISIDPLLEHEGLLFEQGVAGVSLELARHRSIRQAHRAQVDDLLEEVAAGRLNPDLVERTLHRLGSRPLGVYRVLAIGRPTGWSVHDDAVCSVVEDALLALGAPIVGRIDGVIHAVVADTSDAAERVVAALERRGWGSVAVGRSRAKSEIDALRSAIREAGVALQLEDQPAVRDVEAVGLSGLLAGIRDDLGATEFVTRILGPVIEHDRRESAHLVDTLRAYLAHGCRPGPAAGELCVHRHTLAYRLDRIRDLTGRDPRSGDHLVEFGLALELIGRTTQ